MLRININIAFIKAYMFILEEILNASSPASV